MPLCSISHNFGQLYDATGLQHRMYLLLLLSELYKLELRPRGVFKAVCMRPLSVGGFGPPVTIFLFFFSSFFG